MFIYGVVKHRLLGGQLSLYIQTWIKNIIFYICIYDNYSFYVDELKNSSAVQHHLRCDEKTGVKVYPYSQFENHLADVVQTCKKKIWVNARIIFDL